MPSVVATVKIQEGKAEEAVTFFKQLAATVAADEPGTLAYVIHQQQGDPHTIVVYEKYESNEAFAIHGKNLAAKGGEFAGLLAGRPEIVMLEEV